MAQGIRGLRVHVSGVEFRIAGSSQSKQWIDNFSPWSTVRREVLNVILLNVHLGTGGEVTINLPEEYLSDVVDATKEVAYKWSTDAALARREKEEREQKEKEQDPLPTDPE